MKSIIIILNKYLPCRDNVRKCYKVNMNIFHEFIILT